MFVTLYMLGPNELQYFIICLCICLAISNSSTVGMSIHTTLAWALSIPFTIGLYSLLLFFCYTLYNILPRCNFFHLICQFGLPKTIRVWGYFIAESTKKVYHIQYVTTFWTIFNTLLYHIQYLIAKVCYTLELPKDWTAIMITFVD